MINSEESSNKTNDIIYNKGFNESGILIYDLIRNIDLSNKNNTKPLLGLEPNITLNPQNVMINMNPSNTELETSIAIGINNENNVSFSGFFYISFETELFNNNTSIYIGEIETSDSNKNIVIILKKKADGTFSLDINNELSSVSSDITNFYSNNSANKMLTFLVLFKYDTNDLKFKFLINDDKEEKEGILQTTGIIINSMKYGGKISNLLEFKTQIMNDKLYNCYIGGIRFYNILKTYENLKIDAFFKTPPPPTTTTQPPTKEGQPATTQPPTKEGQPAITQQPATTIPVEQIIFKSLIIANGEPFTNYSPSAELFKALKI